MFEFICKPNRLLPAALALVLAAPVVVQADAPDKQPDQKSQSDRPRRERGPQRGQQRNAQRDQQRSPQRDPSAMLDRMHETVNELDLSDEQKSKVDAIFTQAKSDFEAMQEKWDQDNTLPRDRMEQGRDFLRDLNQKVEEVLTDEQKESLREKRQEMMGDRRGPGARPGPGQRGFGQRGQGQRGQGQRGFGQRGDRQGPPATVERLRSTLDQLDLTDEQREQVKSVLDEAREKLQALRDENRGNPQAMREEGRKILDEARDRIVNEILTPEQREKLNENRRPNRNDDGGAPPATEPDKT